MNDLETDDYDEWLKRRRLMSPNDKLTDRIMSVLNKPTPSSLGTPVVAPLTRVRDRIGPALLLTAAAVFFAARIASLVGNLVFPTSSFPEFANDHKIEEPADEHGNVSRS